MKFANDYLASMITLFAHQPYLGHLPKELNDAITVAAGRGFLYAFLCQLDDKFLHPYLRRHGFNDEKILATELIIKSMQTLWFGAGLWKGVCAPLFLFCLMTFGKTSREVAAVAVAGVISGVDFILSDGQFTFRLALTMVLTGLAATLGTAGGLSFSNNRFGVFNQRVSTQTPTFIISPPTPD